MDRWNVRVNSRCLHNWQLDEFYRSQMLSFPRLLVAGSSCFDPWVQGKCSNIMLTIRASWSFLRSTRYRQMKRETIWRNAFRRRPWHTLYAQQTSSITEQCTAAAEFASPIMQSIPFSSGRPSISRVATKKINSESTIVYISWIVRSLGRRVPLIGLFSSTCLKYAKELETDT